MEIAGIQKTSFVDYPGKLCAVVFTPYCNFRCFYCHNMEMLLEPKLIDNISCMDFLKKRIGLLDALVISGGEPTTSTGLKEFIYQVKELGYMVKLDTNGTNPTILKELIQEKMLDYIAIDLKAPFSKYSQICGAKVDCEKIKESIDLLKKSSIPYDIRTTFVPQLNIQEMIETLAEIAPIARYSIQQYKSIEPKRECDRFMVSQKPHSKKTLDKFAELAQQYAGKVVLKV